AGAQRAHPRTAHRRGAGAPGGHRHRRRGGFRAPEAGPALGRGSGVRGRLRAQPRLDQGDGAGLRGVLPDGEGAAEPHRRRPGGRGSRPGARPRGGAGTARPRRDRRRCRHRRTGGTLMITYPPALRSTGFTAPRAIGRMGAAVMEARAVRQERPLRPVRPAPVVAEVQPLWPQPPQRRAVVRLWLPSTASFLLLSPFAILLAPLLWLAPEPYGRNPIRTVFALGAVLLSLSGTVVDVDTPDARVLIRLF